jgi:hypothetical protein
MPGGRASEHDLAPFAVVEDGRLRYPPPQLSLEGVENGGALQPADAAGRAR